MGLDHAMMRPFGRMCRLRRRGDLFGRVCAICESIHAVANVGGLVRPSARDE